MKLESEIPILTGDNVWEEANRNCRLRKGASSSAAKVVSEVWRMSLLVSMDHTTIALDAVVTNSDKSDVKLSKMPTGSVVR